MLDLWDAGARAPAWQRAALLLQWAWPEADVHLWPAGLANARLLELRSALFGAAWHCVADCPACAQVAELRLDIAALLAAAPDAGPATAGRHAVDAGAGSTGFRVPLLGDLAQLTGTGSPAAVRLLDVIADAPCLPAAARGAISDALLRLDPLAAIDLVVDCPACGHQWRAAAEPGPMLWVELSALARRLLAEVAQLASAFGWSEQQVLALPPTRRQCYLDMVPAW
jgi:hypothetical protein